MKKWIIIVLSAALCAVLIAMIEIDVTTKRKDVYIEGGEPVLADDVRQTDRSIRAPTGSCRPWDSIPP